MEKTKRNNEYEYDKSYVIHSLFEDYPVTIRFSKKKNEEVEMFTKLYAKIGLFCINMTE